MLAQSMIIVDSCSREIAVGIRADWHAR